MFLAPVGGYVGCYPSRGRHGGCCPMALSTPPGAWLEQRGDGVSKHRRSWAQTCPTAGRSGRGDPQDAGPCSRCAGHTGGHGAAKIPWTSCFPLMLGGPQQSLLSPKTCQKGFLQAHGLSLRLGAPHHRAGGPAQPSRLPAPKTWLSGRAMPASVWAMPVASPPGPAPLSSRRGQWVLPQFAERAG